ncbi:putative glycolipid-binding domain-containing protein [Arthrobacter sp. ISL-30]|nr:putative glycolipid-binding domain-containing protein [Arthrobacter sp. ISL-30]
MARLTWVDDSETGFENLVVTYGAGRIVAAGHVVGPAETPFEVDYLVQCDESWRTRLVRVTDAANGRHVTLHSDGDGNWTDESGNAVSAAAGATDVDISATPFTNTLPIRRVGLPIGGHIDIVTAYIAVPELVVSADVQRYTRIAERTYRFESRDSDFTRDIMVDGEGFVLDYPGLFTRRFDD